LKNFDVKKNEKESESLLLIAFESVLVVDNDNFTLDTIDEESAFFWSVYCRYFFQKQKVTY
jgi:hypothetical protein